MAKVSWFTDEGDDLLFQRYAARLADWRPQMERGAVTPREAQAQAQHVERLLRELEARVDDETHELLTNALVEWALLQGMQLTLALEEVA